MALDYELRRTNDYLEIRFQNRNWQRAVNSGAWMCVWLGLAGYLVRLLSYGSIVIAGIFIAMVLAAVGGFAVFKSMQQSTLWLSLTEVRLRWSLLPVGRGQGFRRDEVSNLGLGLYSHARTPVLKFENGNRWFVIVWNVTAFEVDQLLARVAGEGFAASK